MEILRAGVADVEVTHELVSGQGYHIGELVGVGESGRRRGCNKADRYAFLPVEENLVKLPDLVASETMLFQRSVCWGRRRRGAKDGLGYEHSERMSLGNLQTQQECRHESAERH